ncbi:MAG: hypothetical protein Kow0042_18160 [Calditrichia bacterium]
MKRGFFYIFFCLPLLLLRCQTESDGLIPLREEGDPIILFDTFSEIKLHSDWMDIRSAEMEGDILRLTVWYRGGCNSHDFHLFVWKGFIETNPIQAECFLSHNSHNDLCEFWIERELAFDMRPLKQIYQQNYGAHGAFRIRIYTGNRRTIFHPLPEYRF